MPHSVGSAPASASTRASGANPRPPLKARLLAETKTYLLIAAYLWIFLATLTTYRQLVQMEDHVSYVHYGWSLIEALILAKLIVIGRVMNLGERFRNRPLIVPTIHKTVCFGLLVVACTAVEHIVVGLWHHEGAAQIYDRIFALGKWEILCRLVMMIIVFAPMFATWELGRYVGEGKIFKLFFKRRPEGARVGEESQEPRPAA